MMPNMMSLMNGFRGFMQNPTQAMLQNKFGIPQQFMNDTGAVAIFLAGPFQYVGAFFVRPAIFLNHGRRHLCVAVYRCFVPEAFLLDLPGLFHLRAEFRGSPALPYAVQFKVVHMGHVLLDVDPLQDGAGDLSPVVDDLIIRAPALF